MSKLYFQVVFQTFQTADQSRLKILTVVSKQLPSTSKLGTCRTLRDVGFGKALMEEMTKDLMEMEMIKALMEEMIKDEVQLFTEEISAALVYTK